MKIEILSAESIRPSSPTPSDLRDFKLSFIDERIPPSYVPLVLYYKFNQDKSLTKHETSYLLKKSLSDALVQFYPLAGRMKGQILVDCNDEGVLYVEAYADGEIVDVIKQPDPWILDDLVPFKFNGYVSSAEEQLAVQATSFGCGGIAIGICMSHRIGDFATLSSFIKCWVTISSGDGSNPVSPVLNSSTLFPPRNTPDFKPNSKSPPIQPLAVKLARERFVFTSSAVQALKSQAINDSPIVKPTRVEVLTAFLWNRCMAAKGLDKNCKSVVFHPVNLRGKFLQLKEHSFGNLFQMTSAESAEETNWISSVEKLRAAFGKIDGEYVNKLLGEKGFELAKENFVDIRKYMELENVEVLKFASYCRFPVDEVDFGWGKPVWVSIAGFWVKDSISLFESLESPGGIEAWVLMADHEMERLKQDSEFQYFTSSVFPPLD